SCGAHSVAWGTTADNVRALSVVRYGGEALRLEQGSGTGPAGADARGRGRPKAPEA
ncbi:hypothetical protein GA0115255_102612, partial [Streptomyces sp. Ncost-T6T-2b]